MQRVSASRIKTYNKCPRQYKLLYELEVDRDQGASTTAMDRGSLFHRGLEVALNHATDTEHLQNALDDLKTNLFVLDRDLIADMLTAYVPYLQIGRNLTPITLPDGTLAVELKFEYPVDDMLITGIIDAVVQDNHGNIILIDWKTRGRMLDGDTVRYDYQLYIYAYVLEKHYGIKPDKIQQVQFSTTPPARPTKKQNGEWSLRMAKTTKQILSQYDDLPPALYDKIADMSHFVSHIEVDTFLVPTMWERFIQNAKRLVSDKTFHAVHSDYTCMFCPVRTACMTRP